MFSARFSSSVLLILVACAALADTSTGSQPYDQSSDPAHLLTALEGKSFSGELGVLGKPASTTDILSFDNGEFVSAECRRRCGYAAGDYWVRADGNALSVKAETSCENSDAVIVWEGKVEGDQIEGTFTWTSKRWYWTFEKQFWFKGKLTEVAETGK